MSEKSQPSSSLPTSVGLPLSQHSSGDMSTESLLFTSNGMTSTLSATSPMMPQDLMPIQGLDSSEASSSFTVSDIVASSNSAIISTGQDMVSEADGLGVTEYQLVDSGNGELIVVTSTLPHKVSGLTADGIASLAETGQTITLNLEEAAQLLLHQHQGLGRTVQLPDGSLQILGQSLVDKESLPLEVLHTFQGDFVQALPAMESSYCLSESGSVIEVKQEMGKTMENETCGDDKDGPEKTPLPVTIQVAGLVDSDKETGMEVADVTEKEKSSHVQEEEMEEDLEGLPQEDSGKMDDEMAIQASEQMEGDVALQVPGGAGKGGDDQVPDMTSPIPVTEQTVIMIKGKKCVLAFNEETQQMCAYPIKRPPGKRRGRPKMTPMEKLALAQRRKQEKDQNMSGEAPSIQSSAAETLLELSSVGADGVRRSSRKRKKARLLEEYEELEDSDEEEPFVDNQDKDPDITLNLPDIKKKKLNSKDESIGNTPSIFHSTVVKRGRGRPRRYPPSGQSQIPTSIPAVIIPSPNGQTLVMTELQGFQNLRTFQRQLPNLVPKPAVDPTSSQVTSEGSEMGSLSLGGESDPLHLDTSEALDNQSIIPTALQGDTEPMVGADGDNLDGADTTTALDSSTGPDKLKEESASSRSESDQLTQPTVIQIPENLLPMLGIKKDPIKIGLKASERDLEKLKCPKCDFQGFYAHQYRAHIATHGDDIHKCKCCSYVSLDADELLAHFKEFHPRCICPECDYMAEHAYIIKRHMMRHNAKSCTCHMCGKVYKDMYILKMHVKMVHMPAEVLFECNICSKKFTRKAHLKRHLRIHEPEKPFKCPHCDYRGCERSDISKHMLIHEEPKHVCERCGKTFRHIKNKELHVKRHYGQRDYKCGVCDFFGYTFTDIRKHIERKHQDIKTLICDKCNKHFRSEIALKEHQQVCNVMMIEQILAIPNSSGGTSQATIQIPAFLGPDGQQIILDGQTMSIDGQSIAVQGQPMTVEGQPLTVGSHHTIQLDGKTVAVTKQESGEILVTEQAFGLPSAGVGNEEELLELEDEDGAMRIIRETILTESGEQIHIIAQESMGQEQQVVSIADDRSVEAVTLTPHEAHQQQSSSSSSLPIILAEDVVMSSNSGQSSAIDNVGKTEVVSVQEVLIGGRQPGNAVEVMTEDDKKDSLIKHGIENEKETIGSPPAPS